VSINDNPGGTLMDYPATPKQTALIKRLADERGIDTTDILTAGLTSRDASRAIDALLAKPTPTATRTYEVPLGMHQTPDGAIYKVQQNQDKTRRYARRLVMYRTNGDRVDALSFKTGETFGSASWEYDKGAIAKLTESTMMTLGQAAAFGVHTNWCCVCGTQLSDPLSVLRGVGPTCGKSMGEPKRTAAAHREAAAILAERAKSRLVSA
jgi:hypothetical protein